MKTEDLIVDLARAAGPVRPLASPSARFARWAAAGVAFASVAVVTIGPRATVAADAERPVFLALAGVTLLTSLLFYARRTPGSSPVKALM